MNEVTKKPSDLSRRDTLKKAGFAVLSIQLLSFVRASAQTVADASMLSIKSGKSKFAPLKGHFHYLNIPLMDFQSPPADGIKLKTTTAYMHHHVVLLTQAQLVSVAQGATLIVQDTVKDHHYAIAMVAES